MTDTTQATSGYETTYGETGEHARAHHAATHSLHMVTLNTFDEK